MLFRKLTCNDHPSVKIILREKIPRNVYAHDIQFWKGCDNQSDHFSARLAAKQVKIVPPLFSHVRKYRFLRSGETTKAIFRAIRNFSRFAICP